MVMKSTEQVREILENTPEAAQEVFWEHDFTPPLCWAALRGCDADIMQLLVDNGADPAQADRQGRTPMQLLERLEEQREQQRCSEWDWLRNQGIGEWPPMMVAAV
jgi:ankyrin repeat protein